MRIFSNFDTKYKSKTVDKLALEFGEENIVVLQKSKLFWAIKIFLPIVFSIIFLFLLCWGGHKLLPIEWFYFLILPLAVLCLVLFGLPIIKNYFDYSMDFTVITPKLLIRYDQEGILSRNVQSINDTNIRTVSVERRGILYSMFNNGDIVFLSESDKLHGTITLHFIHKPEGKRRKIARIMKRI